MQGTSSVWLSVVFFVDHLSEPRIGRRPCKLEGSLFAQRDRHAANEVKFKKREGERCTQIHLDLLTMSISIYTNTKSTVSLTDVQMLSSFHTETD